jgi:putative FmdB family regulatory protein
VPIYEYGCSSCNNSFERLLKMSEMTVPLSQPCPMCESQGTLVQNATAASIGDPIKLGITRPDAGWGDVLSKVKAAHPRGNWSNKKLSPLGGR